MALHFLPLKCNEDKQHQGQYNSRGWSDVIVHVSSFEEQERHFSYKPPFGGHTCHDLQVLSVKMRPGCARTVCAPVSSVCHTADQYREGD